MQTRLFALANFLVSASRSLSNLLPPVMACYGIVLSTGSVT